MVLRKASHLAQSARNILRVGKLRRARCSTGSVSDLRRRRRRLGSSGHYAEAQVADAPRTAPHVIPQLISGGLYLAMTLAGVIFSLVLLPLPCLSQPPAEQIAAKAEKLKTVLAALKLPATENENYAAQLSRLERAARAGQVLSGLYLLQQLEPLLLALDYQKAKAEVEQGGLAAFEQEWLRLGPLLKEKERPLLAKVPLRLPLALQGMSERSLTQVQPYYQSGRLYGQQTTVANGLFYLGLAQAQLEFARFCQSLALTATGARPALRSLAPELAEVEQEILQAYRQPGAAAQQNAFNRINSALKVAQDLERERRLSGALFQYLEVWRLFAALLPPAEQAPLAALKTQSAAFRARLAQGKADHSLAQLHWEVAQATLEAAQPTQDQIKQAAAILNQVLPRYFKYSARSKR